MKISAFVYFLHRKNKALEEVGALKERIHWKFFTKLFFLQKKYGQNGK